MVDKSAQKPSGGTGSDMSPGQTALIRSNASMLTDEGAMLDKKSKRIGDRLVELGVISVDQLDVALHDKQKSGKMVGQTLVDLGFISESVLASFLSETGGYHKFDPKNTMLDPEALELMTQKEVLKYQVLPISVVRDKSEFRVAMVDPYDVMALDKLKQVAPRGFTIVPFVCILSHLTEAAHKAYGVTTSINGILKELAGDKNATKKNLDNLSDEENYTHPIVRLVNAILFEAVKAGASDIHFEPEENSIRVRVRIDGDLIIAHVLHKEHWNGICQRLKIMAQMNIADKLSPQDGRFYLNMGGREADFRVSSLPTTYGENIVLRILDQNASIVPIDKLGFSDHNMKLINKILARPEGIVIVTGPTGSGKTTTLYSMLNALNTLDVNIQTLEDPVEYSLPGIRQSGVREGSGFTFGEGVKALLRQDPDIIFIGEVRDEVTAEQALKAAMTGHKVFSTLHTNDSFGVIPRLADLGLQPGMMAGSIIACFAQRLVRRICANCKASYMASPEECRFLGVDPAAPPTLCKGAGCNQCKNTGYKGRIGIHEILYVDEELEGLIAQGKSTADLKVQARKSGFKNMADDGILKVLEGRTTLESLMQSVNFAHRM